EIGLPDAAARDHAPGAEVRGQREHRGARGAGECARGRLDVAGDRQVEIEIRSCAAQHPVADRAADDPRLRAGERLAGDRERLLAHAGVTRLAPPAASADAPSRWYARVGRRVSAVVIS